MCYISLKDLKEAKMSAEIYLISKMEKEGRITAEQAKELIEIALRKEFAENSAGFPGIKNTSCSKNI